MSDSVDLEAVRELLVEAEGIEATYGPNAYVDYLRKHHHRPAPDEAAAIGKLMGGRVRADDGKLHPPLTKKFKAERRARQEAFDRQRELDAVMPRPVANDG